jgi:hypothetical protein
LIMIGRHRVVALGRHGGHFALGLPLYACSHEHFYL